jgi:hypothetical protein
MPANWSAPPPPSRSGRSSAPRGRRAESRSSADGAGPSAASPRPAEMPRSRFRSGHHELALPGGQGRSYILEPREQVMALRTATSDISRKRGLERTYTEGEQHTDLTVNPAPCRSPSGGRDQSGNLVTVLDDMGTEEKG